MGHMSLRSSPTATALRNGKASSTSTIRTKTTLTQLKSPRLLQPHGTLLMSTGIRRTVETQPVAAEPARFKVGSAQVQRMGSSLPRTIPPLGRWLGADSGEESGIGFHAFGVTGTVSAGARIYGVRFSTVGSSYRTADRWPFSAALAARAYASHSSWSAHADGVCFS